MTASYRLVDYSIRPAKFAERKMLCDIFSRLKAFGALSSYRYIGFGSIWFTDCMLFHRVLGINDIISIEKEEQHKERFEFNNPLGGIKLKLGEAADILPTINWNRRNILWLDYDDSLSPSVLDDVNTVASRAISGTAFCVSVQAEKLLDKRDIHEQDIEISNRELFLEYFGAKRTPLKMEAKDLRGWGIASTERELIRTEIEDALSKVNLGRDDGEKVAFKQVAAFEYADGAKMTTIVGVFVDEGQIGHFESCGFKELSFYRDGDDALRIHIPLLTPKEMRFLDCSLPQNDINQVEKGPLPERDAKFYSRLYRYLPNFASFEP